jgi:hypothetical protein
MTCTVAAVSSDVAGSTVRSRRIGLPSPSNSSVRVVVGAPMVLMTDWYV